MEWKAGAGNSAGHTGFLFRQTPFPTKNFESRGNANERPTSSHRWSHSSATQRRESPAGCVTRSARHSPGPARPRGWPRVLRGYAHGPCNGPGRRCAPGRGRGAGAEGRADESAHSAGSPRPRRSLAESPEHERVRGGRVHANRSRLLGRQLSIGSAQPGCISTARTNGHPIAADSSGHHAT